MSDDDDDLTAAELALGTLDPDERAAALGRIGSDVPFAARVAEWERRLAPLAEAAREVTPPAHLLRAILSRLGLESATQGQFRADRDEVAGQVMVLNRAVRRWRRATMTISALAACLALAIAIDAFRPRTPTPASTLVAVLQRTDNPPAYLVRASLRDHSLSVEAMHATAPAGHSYELWLIDPTVGPPKSLGVLDGAVSSHPLPSGIAPDVLARATYAVTEEPAGGSPTGTPGSAPVFVGHLAPASP